MKQVVCFCLFLALSSAHVYVPSTVGIVGPGSPGAILKGPAAKASVVGSDGTAIAASADTGVIIDDPKPGGVVSASVSSGVVAHTVPVVPQVVPVVPQVVPVVQPLLQQVPVVAQSSLISHHGTPVISSTSVVAEAHAAVVSSPVVPAVPLLQSVPVVSPVKAVISGPSGTIATHGGIVHTKVVSPIVPAVPIVPVVHSAPVVAISRTASGEIVDVRKGLEPLAVSHGLYAHGYY